ncbi:MAG: hypothetical protein GY851_02750, partial [bacterium]|nr:hypothetical protein [bacterium]
MNSRERVLSACAFEQPDRIPRFDEFWEFPEFWRQRLGPPEELTDIAIRVPTEGTFPTRVRVLEQRGDWVYEVDAWGRTLRRREGAYFHEVLEVAMPDGVDVDAVRFDSPVLEERFPVDGLDASKARHFVLAKTGGPYLRTTFVRGEALFLEEMLADPPLARALADKVGDHLMAVGVEALGRWALEETGMWISDDMAYNDGPLFSPDSFEAVLLPAYRRMIAAYKAAGARFVSLHSDGNVGPILDMLVDAGIDGLHPLEPRAHMDMAAVRRRHPNLVLMGGMCNSRTLVEGP